MKFVLNLLLLIATSTAMAQPTIRFQSLVTAQARVVGEVLLISNDTQRLALIPLDSPPKAGSLISKKQLMDLIASKRGLIAYKWQGKKVAKVVQRSQTTGKQLVAKAQQALTEELNKQHYTRLLIKPKTVISPSDMPFSAFKSSIAIHAPPAKRVCVRLIYQKKSIPIWFSVQAYQKVLVAQTNLKMNSPVNTKDFILQERNVAGLKGRPVSQIHSPMWLKHSLKATHILQEQDLGPIPEVLKGQELTIKIRKRGVLVTLQAIALTNGYIGQVIKVKNLQNNKSFKARITDANNAELLT